MKPSFAFAVLSIPVAIALAAPAAAQIVQAAGYATISIAGLGNTTTIAGDSRIPILTRDVTYNPIAGANARLHVRATGRRGAVRQLDIDIQAPRTGQRYEFGPTSAATMRVRMDQGAEIAAESGRGNVTITSIDARRVTGTYEGTFRGGQTPIVLRGRFEASFVRPRTQGGTTLPGR